LNVQGLRWRVEGQPSLARERVGRIICRRRRSKLQFTTLPCPWVVDAAAAPVIKKSAGVLGAVDVFTGPAAFSILESIRLDLGNRMDVHP
jgi:hypothetical protein